jgi:hypothetical protein
MPFMARVGCRFGRFGYGDGSGSVEAVRPEGRSGCKPQQLVAAAWSAKQRRRYGVTRPRSGSVAGVGIRR